MSYLAVFPSYRGILVKYIAFDWMCVIIWDAPLNCGLKFGLKTETLLCRVVHNIFQYNCLGVDHQCDRVTDGRTEYQ